MKRTKQLALGAVLTALALALSYAERFFPLQLLIPLPGVKLGLANLVTVYALYRLGLGQTLAILLLRCTLGAVFGGGVTAWLFSVSGGLAALFRPRLQPLFGRLRHRLAHRQPSQPPAEE